MSDLISRKDAIEALGERPMVWTDDDQYALGERNQYDIDRLAIGTLPSAQPERKKGKWNVREGELAFWDVCDQCGKKIFHRTPFYNFCPNCGADMRGEEDE